MYVKVPAAEVLNTAAVVVGSAVRKGNTVFVAPTPETVQFGAVVNEPPNVNVHVSTPVATIDPVPSRPLAVRLQPVPVTVGLVPFPSIKGCPCASATTHGP